MLDGTASTPPDSGHAGPLGAIDVSVTEPVPGTAVLAVSGEIDSLTSAQFEAAVSQLLAAEQQRLVIDLSGVTFIASSGLTTLVRAADRAAERGIRIGLVTTTRAVRRPLEVTGCDTLFDLFTSLDGATGDAN